MSAAAQDAVTPALADDTVELLLRLGDDALILGHRLSEWVGHSHELEEDLALGNIGLDLLGQARLWLTLAGEREGVGRDEDDLAYLRDGSDYRNLLLAELPNGDFGKTMARQFLFDAWHVPLLEALSASTDEQIAGIAAKGLKEAGYHLRHSAEWVVRLGDGTEESHDRMTLAFDEVWRYTGEMFADDDLVKRLSETGVAPKFSDLRASWQAKVEATLAQATLSMPDQEWMAKGGRVGEHTEYLGYLLAEMQHLHRAHPGAQW